MSVELIASTVASKIALFPCETRKTVSAGGTNDRKHNQAQLSRGHDEIAKSKT